MLFAALALALVASEPQASMQPSSSQAQDRAQVLVCERPHRGREAWSREHGWLTFVTAEALIAGEAARSDRPACITQRELARYHALKRPAAQAFASR